MTLYDVVEADELPTFDPTKMIKHVLLSPANAQRVTRLTRRYSRFITLLYFFGAVLYPVVLFTPSRIGQIVALIETALEIPVCIMVLSSLRADLVFLLVKSYDYWFFSITTFVWSLTFSLLFRDLRVLLVVVRWLGFQMIILIDSNAYQPRPLVIGAVLNFCMAMLNVVALSLDAVPAARRRPVGREDQTHPTISIRDLLVNSLVTMGILLLRLIFHRRELIRIARKKGRSSRDKHKRAVTQCVTLRCSLILRVVTDPNGTVATNPQAPSTPANHVKLRRVVNKAMIYDSSKTFASESVPLPLLRPWHATSIRTVGAIGIVLTSFCSIAMFSTTDLKPSASVVVLCLATILTTTSYIVMSLVHCNRRLLAQICRTFDFIFLSIQISMAHVCVIDMLQWRAVAITTFGCSWLWIHCVLVLDAMLPETKQTIGLVSSRIMGLAVLSAYIVGQFVLLLIGLLWSGWELRNRVFLSMDLLSGYKLEFRVLPFFISRMMTVTLWTLRLLWRYYYQNDPRKLIMLRGQVEFEYDHKARPTLTSIVPITPTPPPAAEQLGSAL